MVAIILPHKWQRQPAPSLRLNDPLGRGLLWVFHGPTRSLIMPGGVQLPASDTSSPRIGKETVGRDYDNALTTFSANVANTVGDGGMAFGVVFDVDALTNYSGIVAQQDTATASGFEFRLGFGTSDSRLLVHRASGGANYRQWAASAANLIAAGQKDVRLTISWPTKNTGDAPIYCLNGIFYTGSVVGGTGVFDANASTAAIHIGKRYDGATFLDGAIYQISMFRRGLSNAEAADWCVNPYADFAPLRRRVYFPSAAAGQTVTVNQALETDLAQAITRLKANTLGQSTETDLAQAITRRKTLAIGQALETDLAQAVTHAKAKLLGQATETDTAQAVAHAKTKALGQATETDLAQAITVSGNKIIAVGQVTETDVAQSLTARKAKQLGQTTETDTAQAVAHAKTKAIGQATETDLAQAITHAKTKGLGLALEIDLGQPIALAPKRRLVAQALETDLAQAVVPGLASTVLPKGKRHLVGARATHIVGARRAFGVDP